MAREEDHFSPMVLDALTQPRKAPTRATCRMTTAKGNRCTGDPLDPDPKAIQICIRHAGEVMQLINEQKRRTRR